MLIEGTSRYYLKKIRAKAKMYEYHIPNELHSTTEEPVNQLIISAIAIIGDFSDVIISNIEGEPFDYKDFQDNLRFAAKFFDGYVESKLYFGDQEYYLLLGAVVYYLCDHNGSSQVLCSRISSDIDLGVYGIDAVLTQILKGDKNVIYNGRYEIVSEICRRYNHFLENGTFDAYGELAVFRRYIYELGSDREVLFADALIAVIYLKIKNSAYELMPQYTEIEFEAWKNVISQGTLVTELWQAQRELGKRGVFWGTSATIQMPTSSGKTKSIALIILSAFLSKRTNYAIVVAPFRSLCREITEELKKAFSFDDSIHVNELSDVLQMDFMDIILGNREMDGDKGVYIVTPEKLLFVLRQNIHILSNVGLMIFDEGHLFDDSSRGITYELLISTIKLYMTDETQKVLISAVIPNAEEINERITDGKGEVIKSNAIQTTEKTVSIAEIKYNRENNKRYAYLYFVNPDNPDEEEFYVPRVITQVNIKLHKRETKERVFPEINNGKNTHKNDIALALAINLCINGGTAIFCGRKDTADGLLNRILDITNRGYDISNLIKCAEKEEVEKLSKLIAMNLGSDSIYFSAAKIGAFVHHGGIPMGIRCSVEYAMQMGLIGFLACTSTLAQGVNLPIRYLIIPTIYQGKDRIKVRDFQNLIGRAGRAGIYTEGNIILSETNVYRYKNVNYENWKWLNYKELLNSNQAEACTSELLSWIRADDEMEKYLNRIIEIFETHYASEDFAETVDSFLEGLKLEKEETYRKADFIVHQMLSNIEAIESFLLFYLMEDTYEEAKDTIHEIIEETLAFHLAKENERERLLHITDLIGRFIVKAVNTSDKRNRYSKSLLGVRKEIEIEQWVQGHIFEIRTCKNEEDILTMIFPLLLRTDNSLIRACNKSELLLEVGLNWIKGINYHDIHKAAIVSGIRILARNKYKLISINQTINLCDNYFGYDCILILAAVIENVSYSCDDMDLDYNFKMLSKRLRQTERSENSRFIETDFTNTNSLIQEIYDNLKDNIWYNYLWNIYSQGKMKGINWIDFETEISQIVELIDREEQNLYLPFKRPVISEDEKANIFFTALKFDKFLIENRKPKEYKPTFRDFLDKSYADLRRLIRCIEIYLIECVEKIHITKISQDIIDAKPVAVLCFNYTHTYVNNYRLGTKDIHYLHGETRNSESLDNNIVLGIDEYYKPEEKDKYTNYNIYKKFTQRIINETGFYYRDWIAKMDDIAYKLRKYPTNEDNSRGLVNNVYIFGHSLDITDKDVIKDLIDREGVKTTIFYYDKQQQTQQIANLVKMLGQNKFIDMVNSVPQKICFVHQKRMKDKQTIN